MEVRMSQFSGGKKEEENITLFCGGLKGEIFHLSDRNGLQNLTEMQPIKSKVILGTETGRSLQRGKGKRTSQADQSLPGYPDFF